MAVRVDKILDDNPDCFKLPASESAAFEKAVFGFVQHTAALGHYYHAQHKVLLNFTVKSHYIGMISRWMNPRRAWCYGGEDMMQLVKKYCAGSMAGSDPAAVIVKVVNNYAQGLGLDLQWSHRK